VGSSGAVYSAEHTESGESAAVKIIHSSLPISEREQEVFLQQTSLLADDGLPGVLPVWEAGQLPSGQLYVVSSLSVGEPLTDLLIDSAPLHEEQAIPLLKALALLLASVHEQGLIHGNLTPENISIVLHEDGQWPPEIWLMDLTMSLLHQYLSPEDQVRPPYYLAPEQIRGEVPLAATDIYALGVIAFQLLTGRLPFSSARPVEVLVMHLDDAPPSPRSIINISPEAEAWLLKAMAKDPLHRFEDMMQAATELDRIIAPAPAAPPVGEAQQELEPATTPMEPAAPVDSPEEPISKSSEQNEVSGMIVLRDVAGAPTDGLDYNDSSVIVEKEFSDPPQQAEQEPDKEEPDKEEPGKEEPGKEEPGKEEPEELEEFPADFPEPDGHVIDMSEAFEPDQDPLQDSGQYLAKDLLSDDDFPADHRFAPEDDENLDLGDVFIEALDDPAPEREKDELYVPPGRDPILFLDISPLVALVIAILTALAVGAWTYHMLTGHWPYPLG